MYVYECECCGCVMKDHKEPLSKGLVRTLAKLWQYNRANGFAKLGDFCDTNGQYVNASRLKKHGLSISTEDGHMISDKGIKFLSGEVQTRKFFIERTGKIESYIKEQSDEYVSVHDILREDYFDYADDYGFGQLQESKTPEQESLFTS